MCFLLSTLYNNLILLITWAEHHLTPHEMCLNTTVTLSWPKCRLQLFLHDASSLACYAQIQFGTVHTLECLHFPLSAHTSKHTLAVVASWSLRNLNVASVTASLTHARNLCPHH